MRQSDAGSLIAVALCNVPPVSILSPDVQAEGRRGGASAVCARVTPCVAVRIDFVDRQGRMTGEPMPVPDLRSGSSLRAAAEAMAEGPIAYLLGAGASVSAGLPGWGELLRRLLAERGLEDAAISRLLQSQDNLLVAEAAFAPGSRRRTREKQIFKALYGTADIDEARRAFTPSKLHAAVAADALRRGERDTSIMTLNYDDLQEEALVQEITNRRRRDPSERVHARSDATNRASSQQFEVHHLHGLLPRQSLAAPGDELVLTLSDYSRLIDNSWQRVQVSGAVQHGPTLMLGTSYSDPDIRTWLGALSKYERRELLAVISRPAFGISRAQMDKIRPVVEAQWKRVGVQVLVVDDFATPTQIVRELGYVNKPDYASPTDRVAGLLQRRLADTHELTTQTKRFKAALGDSAMLTLWLHDGADHLVRWATSDRTYRDPAALRRIDVNPDSAWIVARAVCNDTEVIRDIDVRTAELRDSGAVADTGITTGRWVSVAARPLVVTLPGGPAVTVGALSVASSVATDDVDISLLQDALDVTCRRWQTRLGSAP
jgi:hypothetical protein